MLKLFLFPFFVINALRPAKSQIISGTEDVLGDPSLLGLPIFSQYPEIPKNISEKCALQLQQFFLGLNNTEMWALQMFDASSKVQSGILRGNIVDLGSFDECLMTRHMEIRGKYCLLTADPSLLSGVGGLSVLEQVSSHQGIQVQRAVCVPDACSVDDLTLWLTNGTKSVLKVDEEYCQSYATAPKLAWDSILVLCILGTIAIVVLMCSVMDYFRRENHAVVKAFSALANGKKLLSSSNDPEKMKCLDGLRAVSMAWVVLAHVFQGLAWVPLANYLDVLDVRKQWYSMVIVSATLAVDTFFLLSGFLLSYTILKSLSKGIKMNIPLVIFHRYIRLTPALLVVVMMHATLFQFLGTGPVYPHYRLQYAEDCKRYWWSALLYLQNLVNNHNKCVPQSWYLSVDMQLFIISLPLMLLLRKRFRIGLAVIVFLIFFSMAISFAIGWIYETAGSLAGSTDNRGSDDYDFKYYYQSHTRMAPYLMGLLLGYLLHYIKQKHLCFKINSHINMAIWIADLIVLFTCVFAGHHAIVVDTRDRASNSSYLAFHRPAWAVGISWIIIACILDHGGIINKILSLRVFEILSRLSYTMYLLHYAMINLRYLTIRTPIRFDIVDQFLGFWGFYAASAFFSAIFTLLFESPVIALEKLMFQRAAKSDDFKKKTEENGDV